MFDTAMTGSAHQPASTPSELDEKCRRVIGRHNRLRRLSKMRSLEIIIRNQQRMLEAAVDELFDDAEVGVIVASIGGETFTDWFNHLAGTDIKPPATYGPQMYQTPWSSADTQTLGGVS